MQEIITMCLAGAAGSIVKDCVEDGKIQIPYFKDGYFFVGFIGGIIVGAFVGYVVDGNILSAAMGGYAGTSAIQHLLLKVPIRKESQPDAS